MQIRALLFAAACCLFQAEAGAAPASARQQKTSIPAMATLAGVRVGLDTIEKLERRLGAGLVCLGGHPNGGRRWRSKRLGWEIYADGFNYNKKGGRVLSAIILSVSDKENTDPAPAPSVARSSLRFMGKVALGMSRRQVEEALREILPPPDQKGDLLLWKAKGFSPLSPNHHDDIREWEAELSFQNGKLVKIFISSDEN